jgi:carbon-monoxide dehydrogenase medium subunit
MTVQTSDVAYHAPETVEAARERLAETEGFVKVVAGGQTLMLLLRQGFVQADALVDVSRVDSLSGVSVADGRATVGATTTYADLLAHDLSDRVAMLGEACAGIADRQVRNAGTIGGALAHADPAFDVVPPLLCLEPEVRIGNAEGSRTIPLRDLFVGHMRTALDADDLLEAIAFDLPDSDRTGTAYEKHADVEGGWATVGASALVTLDGGRFEDVRVGLTAVADSAVRSPAVEEELTGEAVTGETISAASDAVTADIDPLDDLSGSAAYKRGLAATLVERGLRSATRRAGGEL